MLTILLPFGPQGIPEIKGATCGADGMPMTARIHWLLGSEPE
jgi:hypothetical protein